MVPSMSVKTKKIQIAVQKPKLLDLKSEEELEEIEIDLEREANVRAAD